MDRTLVGSQRVEVRGGRLRVIEGESEGESLDVGPEPQIVGRRPGVTLSSPTAR